MKFLCITCDEALRHQDTRGPEEGVMTVIFACPGCGWEMAMFTNPWETQMVRSLDVKIGGRTVPAEPLEMLRSSLGQGKETLSPPHVLRQQVTTPPSVRLLTLWPVLTMRRRHHPSRQQVATYAGRGRRKSASPNVSRALSGQWRVWGLKSTLANVAIAKLLRKCWTKPKISSWDK